MQAVRDEIETIHLYVVREEEKRPATALPLFCAFVCLLSIAAITIYSAVHPTYEHMRLVVPAQFLPLRTFEAEAPIIPTGVKTYPATYATGVLTLTNGSVIGMSIPQGFTIGSVATDKAVYVPPGSAAAFGYASVTARALISGKAGNFASLAINTVIGSSLYVRNLSPFTGGRNNYRVAIQLPQDRETAMNTVRSLIASQIAQVAAVLAGACKETIMASTTVIQTTWNCQFATYTVPLYMYSLGAQLVGKNFLVDVVFVARPERMWAK